jgi:hypothetical protein
MSAVDWDLVKREFCAGLSLREIARVHNEANPGATVSHVSVDKRAKAEGWGRDLKEAIARKAEAMVQRAAEIRVGLDEATETEVIEANAERIAIVRGSHRRLVTRLRAQFDLMLKEFEQLPEGGRLSEEKAFKSMCEDAKTIIGLERQAYSVDSAPETVEDSAPLDRTEIARKVAFMLTREAIEKAKV